MSSEASTTESKRSRRKDRPVKNEEAFKKLRVIVLCHEDLVPPESIEGLSAKEVAPFKTEWDVISTLRTTSRPTTASSGGSCTTIGAAATAA